MRIIERDEDRITFHHLGHIYQVSVADCEYSKNPSGTNEERFLLTPEMICVRENCPECARAAEARGMPGYRTPARTCFPLLGDSEAMEMHLRYRLNAPKAKRDLVLAEIENLMMSNDEAVKRRLAKARECSQIS